MVNDNEKVFMTINEIGRKGILPTTALRRLVKEEKIQVVKIGSRQYINYPELKKSLNIE